MHVQAAILVVVDAEDAMQPTLLAYLAQRGCPLGQPISFGPGSGCTRAGLPDYCIGLPVSHVLHGIDVTLPLNPAGKVHIDLFTLQRDVCTAMEMLQDDYLLQL